MLEVLGLSITDALKYGGGIVTGGAATLAVVRGTMDWFFNREYETIIVYQSRVTNMGEKSRHYERNEVLTGRLPDIIRGSNIRKLMTDAAKSCVAGKGIDVDRRFLVYDDDKIALEVGNAVTKALKSFLWRERFLDEADGIPSTRVSKHFIVGGADSPLNSKKVIRITIVNDADIADLSGSYVWETDTEMNLIGLETAKILAKSLGDASAPGFHKIRGEAYRVVHSISVPVRA